MSGITIRALFVSMTLFNVQCRCFSQEHQSSGQGAVTIYQNQEWYQERSEQEVYLEGIIEQKEETSGPNTRLGLKFLLVSDNWQLPIYAPGVEDQLMPFCKKRVKIRGKIIDLSEEGFGREIWIGAVVR